MKKNLLFIIDNLKGGGAERILITILQHLDAKKYGSYIPPDPKPGGYNLCL